MNHWLKRIAIVAPPVIIAGVYFGYIPVGVGLRSKIDQFRGKSASAVVVQSNPASVEKVIGDAYMRDRPGLDPVKLKGGELLKKGATVATGEKSFALLSVRGATSWLLKLGPNSEVNIDDLNRESESLSMNLIRGGVLSVVKNKKPGRVLSVRTKYASFAIRGTTFAILTDGETKAVLTVKEGTVEAENFKTLDKALVKDAHSFIVNREGESKLQFDLDAVDLYEWDAENLEAGLPAMDAVLEKTGDLGPTPDEKERAHQEFLQKIDAEITAFKTQNEELNRELEILKDNAEKSREGLRQEIRRVEKDIKCIETSVSECNLLSDKILIQRGFPRLWGNPKYRNSMIVDLQKYLQERDQEVDIREEEAKILTDLMNLRMKKLREVETDRAAGSNLETLIPKLQDARLRR